MHTVKNIKIFAASICDKNSFLTSADRFNPKNQERREGTRQSELSQNEKNSDD